MTGNSSKVPKFHMMPEIVCAVNMGLQVKALLSWRHALVIFFRILSMDIPAYMDGYYINQNRKAIAKYLIAGPTGTSQR